MTPQKEVYFLSKRKNRASEPNICDCLEAAMHTVDWSPFELRFVLNLLRNKGVYHFNEGFETYVGACRPPRNQLSGLALLGVVRVSSSTAELTHDGLDDVLLFISKLIPNRRFSRTDLKYVCEFLACAEGSVGKIRSTQSYSPTIPASVYMNHLAKLLNLPPVTIDPKVAHHHLPPERRFELLEKSLQVNETVTSHQELKRRLRSHGCLSDATDPTIAYWITEGYLVQDPAIRGHQLVATRSTKTFTTP